MAVTAQPIVVPSSAGSDLDLIPQMVMSPAEMKRRMGELQAFVKEVMVEGIDYGPPFPGSDKKTLLKPGAEKLAEIYGYTVEPVITQRIEIWDPPHGPFFAYDFECLVRSKRSGLLIGKGVGSCNTKENRYRWRAAGRVCPQCGKENTIIKGKREFGGGWLCFGKRGGCGEKFKDGDAAIENQEVGRVENDDVHTLVNTVLKIAKKRAYVDAVIAVTQSSGLFTGEDEDEEHDGEGAGPRGSRSSNTGSGAGRGGAAKGQSAKPGNGGGDKPPDDAHPTKVVVRGETHWTAGIEFKGLLRVWELLRAYDARFGKDSGKAFMKKLVGVDSSHDLNVDMGAKVIEALQGELDNAGSAPPADSEHTDPYSGQ